MAASIERYNASPGRPSERAHHAREVEAAGRCIVVRVVCKLEARAAKERHVIGPGGSADMDGGARSGGLDQFCSEAQRAAASWRLNRAHATRGQRWMTRAQGE